MKKILIIIMCMFLLVAPLISSAGLTSIDDFKTYDKSISTYNLKNFFGLGKTISTLELKTPQNYEVGLGYQKVAEIDIINGEYNYEEIINGIELYNIRDGMKEVIRNVDYKYQVTIQVPNYVQSCNDILSKNGTILSECSQIESGTRDKITWEDFTKNSLKIGEEITLGLFTTTKQGDHIEWILNVYGNERLIAWASWDASLNTDLQGYWNLDEGSGTTVTDVTGNGYTGTVTNSSDWNATGKIGGGYACSGTSSFYIGTNDTNGYDDFNSYGNEFTIAFWVIDSGNYVANTGYVSKTNEEGYKFGQFTLSDPNSDAGWKPYVYMNDTDPAQIALATTEMDNLNWNHIVLTYSLSNTNLSLYINGTAVASVTKTIYNTAQQDSSIRFCEVYSSTYKNMNVDEVGYWNRSLSAAEVSVLYAGGEGMTYPKGPTVTLNSPANTTNTTNPTINFNGTISDYAPLNVSLIIDGAYNETNTSGILGDYLFTKILGEGDHTWNYESCNADGCNNGTERSLTIDFVNPIVTLYTPINTTNSTTNLISFVCNATDNTLLENISLILDGSIVNTTLSPVNNTPTTFIRTLTDGNHDWNCEAWDNQSKKGIGVERRITIDTINPTFSFKSPPSEIETHVIGNNLWLNVTTTDSNLNICWYEYNLTNTTFSCTSGSQQNETFATVSGNQSITVWANDTLGNTNSSSISWIYQFLETGTSQDTSVFETKNYTFGINVSTGLTIISFSALLNYNGTTYTADSSCVSGDCEISAVIDIPLLSSGQTTENKTFYWELMIFNGTSTSNINTSTRTQNVSDVNFGSCAGLTNLTSVNFTTHKEADRSALNTIFASYFQYYLGTGSVKKIGNYSGSATSVYDFCINEDENFYVNSQIDLSATSYLDRTYQFQKQIYSDTDKIQPLYLLNSTLGTNIIIEVKNEGLSPIKGITVNISRFYPAIGSYIMVESKITDGYGQIVSKLIENDVKYKFAFYSPNNVLLKTEELISIACHSSICVLPFIIVTTEDDFERFDDLTKYISAGILFNNVTNTFTYSWNDQRGETPVSTRLEVKRYALNESGVVCNSTSTSLLSTLTCAVGSTRASYIAQLYRTYNGNTLRLYELNVKVGDPSSTFGVEGLFWVFILLFTCIGLGSFNPSVGAVLYLTGFIAMGIAGIISMPLSVFFANTVLTVLFLWAVNKT